jgi:hypothetical protein
MASHRDTDTEAKGAVWSAVALFGLSYMRADERGPKGVPVRCSMRVTVHSAVPVSRIAVANGPRIANSAQSAGRIGAGGASRRVDASVVQPSVYLNTKVNAPGTGKGTSLTPCTFRVFI